MEMFFPGKVLSNREDQDCPACSPNLTVCDFVLYGHLKHQICSQDVRLQQRNLRQLKEAIRNQCAYLNPAFGNCNGTQCDEMFDIKWTYFS